MRCLDRRGGCCWPQLDRYLADLAGKVEWDFVGAGDSGAFIRANVRAFVSREDAALGATAPNELDKLKYARLLCIPHTAKAEVIAGRAHFAFAARADHVAGAVLIGAKE